MTDLPWEPLDARGRPLSSSGGGLAVPYSFHPALNVRIICQSAAHADARPVFLRFPGYSVVSSANARVMGSAGGESGYGMPNATCLRVDWGVCAGTATFSSQLVGPSPRHHQPYPRPRTLIVAT